MNRTTSRTQRLSTVGLIVLIILTVASPLAAPARSLAAGDTTAPLLVYPAVNRTVLTLTYDEPLDESSVPAPSDVSVEVLGAARTVSGVGINGDTVTLSLETSVSHTDSEIYVSYTPGTTPIRDLAGNTAASLTHVLVTNDTSDPTPGLLDAGVNRSLLILTYDKVLDELSVPTAADFAVEVGQAARAVAGVAVSRETITLTLASRVASSDFDIYVSYTPGTNPIRDAATKTSASPLSSVFVANNTPNLTPVLLAATVDYNSITLTYDRQLDESSTPALTDYSVQVNDVLRSISTVAVSGGTVVVTLSSPVTSTNDDIFVSYTPGGNPVREAAENTPADAFESVWVTNNTSATDEPQTSITSGPSDATSSTSAAFQFASSRSPSTFECQLDTLGWTACTSPQEYTNLSASPHTFQVRATDNSGHVDLTPASQTWTVDLTPPDVTLTAPMEGAAISGDVEISAEATDNVDVDRVEFLVNGKVIGTDDSAPYSRIWHSASAADGTATVSARAFDTAGSSSTSAAHTVMVSNPLETTIDTGPSGTARKDSAVFEFSSNKADATFSCQLDNLGFSPCESPEYYSGLSDGPHTFQVYATDGSGIADPTPDSSDWTADTSGIRVQESSSSLTPHNLANSLLDADSYVSISNVRHTGADRALGEFQGGDSIIGFDKGIILSTGDVTNSVGHNIAPDTSTDNGEPGDATLTDSAGYPTSDASVLEFEFVPTHSRVTLQYAFASEEYNEYISSEFNDVVRLFVNGSNCATVGGTDVSVDSINLNSHPELYRNNQDGAINTEMDGLTTVLTCTMDVTPGATNHMKLAIADAGDSRYDSNVYLAAGSLASVDTTPPSVALTSPSGGALVRGTITLSSTASDNAAVDRVEFLLNTTVLGTDTTSPYTLSWDTSTVADGSYTLTARATDGGGNTASSDAVTVSVDNTAPTSTITSSPSGYVPSTSASFAFSSESGATLRCVLDGGAESACASPKSYTGLAQGAHTFKVRAVDTAGNLGAWVSRSWSVDTVTPTGSILINAGAAYARSTSVNLKLAATDAGSGVAAMRIRNSNTTTWSAPQAYSTSAAWTLPAGNGSKTVYVQYQDRAGNWSTLYGDSIYLDTTLPVAGAPLQSIVANTQLGTSTMPVRITWSGSDTGSGIAKYQVQQRKYGSTAWGAWGWVTSGTTAKTLDRQLAPGGYQFQARAMDQAGNWSAWKAGLAFTVTPYQETSTATAGKLAYSGSWTRQYLSSAYGTYTKYATVKGSYATFSFTGGKQVAWVAPRVTNGGYADVYLDGVKVATVNLYSASLQPRRVVFAKVGLNPSVTHTIKVYVTGTKQAASSGTRVDIDAFVVVR